MPTMMAAESQYNALSEFPAEDMNDLTRILQSIDESDPRSADELIALVYSELRGIAAARLRHEKPGQTLSATALVHEAFVRLTGKTYPQGWKNEEQFFFAAAEAMRRILVEKARRKRRTKHGGGLQRVDLENAVSLFDEKPDDLLALNEALEAFSVGEPEACQVVKLRYFVGLTIEETAQALSISVRTANRHWAYAKAWLYKRLN